MSTTTETMTTLTQLRNAVQAANFAAGYVTAKAFIDRAYVAEAADNALTAVFAAAYEVDAELTVAYASAYVAAYEAASADAE